MRVRQDAKPWLLTAGSGSYIKAGDDTLLIEAYGYQDCVGSTGCLCKLSMPFHKVDGFGICDAQAFLFSDYKVRVSCKSCSDELKRYCPFGYHCENAESGWNVCKPPPGTAGPDPNGGNVTQGVTTSMCYRPAFILVTLQHVSKSTFKYCGPVHIHYLYSTRRKYKIKAAHILFADPLHLIEFVLELCLLSIHSYEHTDHILNYL